MTDLPSSDWKPNVAWFATLIAAVAFASLVFLAYIGANHLLGICAHG